MFAIVRSGGKQYKVSKEDKIKVEKLPHSEGDKVVLGDVLFLQRDDGNVVFGSPFIDGARVEAEVLRNYKEKKVIVFKKRRRQNSRRKNGHRQQKMELKILNIIN